MPLDSTPIDVFIRRKYATPQIQKIVDSWKLEPELVITMLIANFREMGFYTVVYGQEKLVLQTMLAQLQHSPDILQTLLKAQQEEMRRMRNNRHVG